jgi:hypothetical protein
MMIETVWFYLIFCIAFKCIPVCLTKQSLGLSPLPAIAWRDVPVLMKKTLLMTGQAATNFAL